jgi:hypothetical protein
MDIDRRSFLQILSTAIALPIIAQAALPESRVSVPGLVRVRQFRGSGCYANAVFTPGNFSKVREVLHEDIIQHAPPDTPYELIAVPLSLDEMIEAVGYRREGYACLWLTDGNVRREGIFLGRYRVGRPPAVPWWTHS